MGLKSCKYCCKIHERSLVCDRMPIRTKTRTEADGYRNTKRWKLKSIAIKERDLYICRVCRTGLYNTVRLYNYDSLSVHHIVPIREAAHLTYEDSNLITLCRYHHEQAEKGVIDRPFLRSLIELSDK